MRTSCPSSCQQKREAPLAGSPRKSPDTAAGIPLQRRFSWVPGAGPETLCVMSHRRRDAVAAHIDGGRFERAVLLLVGGADEDLGAWFELALVAGNERHDHRLGHDDDLLVAILVFERDFVALHAF